MRGKYKKLVRDKIKDLLIQDGYKPQFKVLKKKDFKQALINKLKEEVQELSEAKNKIDMIEELADIQEVMLSIYEEYGIGCSDVTKQGRLKRKKKGAFTKRIFIEEVK